MITEKEGRLRCARCCSCPAIRRRSWKRLPVRRRRGDRRSRGFGRSGQQGRRRAHVASAFIQAVDTGRRPPRSTSASTISPPDSPTTTSRRWSRARPDGIMLPKCNAGAEVAELAAMLRVHGGGQWRRRRPDQDHRADHRDRGRRALGRPAIAIQIRGLAGVTWGTEGRSSQRWSFVAWFRLLWD